MGKSSATSAAKSKEAREARKSEQRRLADRVRLVTAANGLRPAELERACGELLQYTLDQQPLQIFCKRVADLEPELLAWAVDLTERNMKKLYDECTWGWDLRKKTEEMSEDAAWYVVVRPAPAAVPTAAPAPPLAFAHFRFDMDYGTPVLYCYELQVEEGARGRGVGARLLRVLERLAGDTRMCCVRLTALRHNPRAAAFFRTCGYSVDETSPAAEEAAHYEILSKPAPATPSTPAAPDGGDDDARLAARLESACAVAT